MPEVVVVLVGMDASLVERDADLVDSTVVLHRKGEMEQVACIAMDVRSVGCSVLEKQRVMTSARRLR